MTTQDIKAHLDCIDGLSKLTIQIDRITAADDTKEIRIRMEPVWLPANVAAVYQQRPYEVVSGPLADIIKETNEFLAAKLAPLIAAHKEKIKAAL